MLALHAAILFALPHLLQHSPYWAVMLLPVGWLHAVQQRGFEGSFFRHGLLQLRGIGNA